MRNLLFMLLVFISFSVSAQNEMASGKITNPRGEPVSFATITVKGTKDHGCCRSGRDFQDQGNDRADAGDHRSVLFISWTFI